MAARILAGGLSGNPLVPKLRRPPHVHRYNSAEEKEELLEESGWKLVHADVLRNPPQSTLLATSIGTGMQVRTKSSNPRPRRAFFRNFGVCAQPDKAGDAATLWPLLSALPAARPQLLCMAFISIGCAMLGFLSPANRGSMLTVTLLLFVRICVDECSAP